MQSSPQLAEEHRKMFEKIAEHAEEMKVHSFDSMVDPVLVVSATVYLKTIHVCEITRS